MWVAQVVLPLGCQVGVWPKWFSLWGARWVCGLGGASLRGAGWLRWFSMQGCQVGGRPMWCWVGGDYFLSLWGSWADGWPRW